VGILFCVCVGGRMWVFTTAALALLCLVVVAFFLLFIISLDGCVWVRYSLYIVIVSVFLGECENIL
jgi:hypothetical protein